VRRNTTVVVGWDRSLSDGGRPNDMYYVVKYRKVSSLGPFTTAGQTSESPFTVQRLKPVTRYFIRITAENGVSDQEPGSKDERTTEIVVVTREGSKLPHRKLCQLVNYAQSYNAPALLVKLSYFAQSNY